MKKLSRNEICSAAKRRNFTAVRYEGFTVIIHDDKNTEQLLPTDSSRRHVNSSQPNSTALKAAHTIVNIQNVQNQNFV